MYVDDALLLGLSQRQMELKLAALIEVIFVIWAYQIRQFASVLLRWTSGWI
jgi:hypothetical protein